jgi:hypothetical protein
MRKMTASQMEDELAVLMGRTAVDRKRIEYLERESKANALRIKTLEDALTQALESISIITNTVIK